MAESENVEAVTPPKSKRDVLGERLRQKYPDRDYADDEALFGQINDDYDDYEGRLQRSQEGEQKLLDTFNKNPHSAHFLADMVKGRDPWLGLIERIGVDGLREMLDDPEKREAFAEANQKNVERMAEEKNLEEECEKNSVESLEVIKSFQQERGLTDEQIDEAINFLRSVAQNVMRCKYTPDDLGMAVKALNYESAVAEASQEGEVRGKNSRARMELRKPTKGDGLPQLGGSNNRPEEMKPDREKSIFDWADEAK